MHDDQENSEQINIPAAEKVMDLGECLERTRHDKDLLLELVKIFKKDFQKHREKLTLAVGREDWEQIKEIAHFFKGASANISAHILYAVFSRLEKSAEEKDSAKIFVLLNLLDQAFEEFMKFTHNLNKKLRAVH